MATVLIVLEGAADAQTGAPMPSSPVMQCVDALKQAIAADPILNLEAVRLVAADQLEQTIAQLQPHAEALLCPLTLNLPSLPAVPQIYRDCRDVVGLRAQVSQRLSYAAGEGNLWLPIVLTARGALFGEVIAPKAKPLAADSDTLAPSFKFPLHLSDRWRQPLYRLGQQLIRLLQAPPSVYLLQFGFVADQVCFDRLIPFPDGPALASLNVQSPDLFTCHWRCLTQQAILDLAIAMPVDYEVYEPCPE